MKKKLTQHSLFQSFEAIIPTLPDSRRPERCFYSMRDGIFTAFSTFFLQSPSLANHHALLTSKQGGKNSSRLFKLKGTPCENQLRNLLDPLSTDRFCDVQDDMVNKLQRSGVLEDFKETGDIEYPFSIDGVEFFRSKAISCPHCCKAHLHNGDVDYFHRLLLGGLVHPKQNIFLPISQEFIVHQDGIDKEDCEKNAFRRWYKNFRRRHPHLKLCLMGDDIFCVEWIMQEMIADNNHFILSCQPGSHPFLYDWIETMRKGGDLKRFSRTYRIGKHWLISTFEYANDVPCKDGKNVLRVGFCMETIQNRETNETVGVHAFITDLKINCQKKCQKVVALGRRHWKSENEGNNTLKNQGYYFGRNYGHGQENLANNFILLNLIAFTMHLILEYVAQEGYALVKKFSDSFKSYTESIRGTFRQIACSDWEEFYSIALGGLDLFDTS